MTIFALFLQEASSIPVTDPGLYWGLKPSEWIMIAAIIFGPIFAVLTQLYWQRWRAKRDQKVWVFSTLMSLRAQPLAPEYIRALNNIDVVFYENAKVRARWKTLLKHFESDAYEEPIVKQATWDTARDLSAELLAEIATDLGYKYDHTHIKKEAYYPKGLGDVEGQILQLLASGTKVLAGDSSLMVKLEEGDDQEPPPQT